MTAGLQENALPTKVDLLEPFPACSEIIFGRIAARSPAFGRNSAAGGNQVVVGSAAGRSAEAVKPRARGELLERAINILAGRRVESEAVAGRATVASFTELRKSGRSALDPAAWPGCGLETRECRQQWVEGTCAESGETMLVPAGAVFLQHRSPAVISAGSTGLAAHRDHASALRHALLETLERDLIWRAWYGDAPGAKRITIPARLESTVDSIGCDAAALLLSGPAGTGCVVVCLSRPSGHEQAFGARCVMMSSSEELSRGVETALYEALMIRWSMGTKAAEIAWREWHPSVLPRNPVEHALAAFHRRSGIDPWHYLCERLGLPATDFEDEELATIDHSGPVNSICAHAQSAAVVVDTTIPGMCPDGTIVLRVVVPGARCLPGDERQAVVPAPGGHRPPPHPFG